MLFFCIVRKRFLSYYVYIRITSKNMKLDNQNLYKKLDTGYVAESIELLPDQIRDVLEVAHLVKIPKEYSEINRVVISGMGGSNLGAHLISSTFSDVLKTPIIITAGYEVPEIVNDKTLYVLSSYSGTTEEVLSCYKNARKKGAKIIAITSGGELENLIKKDDLPGFVFRPKFNPSGQPRLGLGYSLFGMMVLLAKAGLFVIEPNDIREIINFLELHDRLYRPIKEQKGNLAKEIAAKIHGKTPILVGSEFLRGNLHVLRNQFCETSKNFCSYLFLPDLNHFAMEGLAFPGSNSENLIFVFIDSLFYDKRIQRRSELTKKVVGDNKIETLSIELKGKTKLEQSFEMLQIGTWITYYLGILNEVDPVKVPFVDWFKSELNKK